MITIIGIVVYWALLLWSHLTTWQEFHIKKLNLNVSSKIQVSLNQHNFTPLRKTSFNNFEVKMTKHNFAKRKKYINWPFCEKSNFNKRAKSFKLSLASAELRNSGFPDKKFPDTYKPIWVCMYPECVSDSYWVV